MIQGFGFQVNNFTANQSKVNLRNNHSNSKNNFNEILDTTSKSRQSANDKSKLQSKNDEIMRQQNAQINNRKADIKNEQVKDKPKEQAKESDVKQEETIITKKEKTIEELIENLSELLVVFQNVVGINVDELEEVNLEDLNLEISIEELENLTDSLENVIEMFDMGDSEQEIQEVITNIGKMIQEVKENGETEVLAEEFIGELKEVVDLINSKVAPDSDIDNDLSKEVEKPSTQLQNLIKTIENTKEKSGSSESSQNSQNLESSEPSKKHFLANTEDNKEIKIKIVTEKQDGKNLFDLLGDLEDLSTIEEIDSSVDQMPINILSNNTDRLRPEDLGKVANNELKPEQFMDIDKSDVLKQITSKIKADYKNDLNEIKITLTPEHLGALTIKVSLERGILSARAFVENANVKQLLESNINELKENLKEQGVDFASLDVSVGSDSDSKERNSNFFMDHKRVKGLKTKIETRVDMSQYEELNEHNQSSSMEIGEGSMDITV